MVTGWAKFSRGILPDTSTDIWRSVQAARQGRIIKIIKVESHLDEAPAERQALFNKDHIKLNIMADAFAEEAAQQCQIDQGEVAQLEWRENIVRAVQTRLMAIMDAVREQDPRADLQGHMQQRKARQAELLQHFSTS